MNTLAYLYIYGLEGYVPFELNFSNHFNFKMLDHQILNIERASNPMKDLLGDNIFDINIIAGENGVGKSTLIKLIANLLTEKTFGNEELDFEYFALFHTSRYELAYKSSGFNHFVYDKEDLIEIVPGGSHLDTGRPIIYYSPFLDFNLLSIYNAKGNYPIIDLSNTQVMISDLEEKYTEEEQDDLDTMEIESHPLIQHKLKNIKRQVAFVNSYASTFDFPFKMPKTLELRFHRLSINEDDVSIYGNEVMERFRSMVAEHLREFPESGMSRKNMARLIFLRNLLTLYFVAINNDKSQDILHHNYTPGLSSQIQNFDNKDPKILIALIEKFFKEEDVFKSDIFRRLIKLAKEGITEHNVHFSDSNNLLTVNINTKGWALAEVFGILRIQVKKQDKERHILPALSKFISFDWSNFSSGEKMFIDLFSRLSDSLGQLGNSTQPILLLIDEGEMGFHPLWQIMYVSTLVDFVNNIFYNYRVQILLATHSPLVLSDFPKDRVHLFKKSAGKRRKVRSIGTFAQSTSELLANDFFIESTLIGNLAKAYINDILQEINRFKGKISRRRYLSLINKIKKIDDPIIYRLLIGQLEGAENA